MIIDEAIEVLAWIKENSVISDEYKKAMDMAIEALKQEPKTGEWIPVSERLPEEFSVLCCDNHGEMLIAHPFECDASDTGFSAENDGCYMYNCIACMPLPMPYTEGREDYELATEQMEHDIIYEPTYNSEDGSM